MKLWKPKYSVCKECKVHFEPVSGYEARWGDLCQIHRKPVMDEDIKREAVISWATANWKKLIEIMEKEKEETRKLYQSHFNKMFNQTSGNQYFEQQRLGNLFGMK